MARSLRCGQRRREKARSQYSATLRRQIMKRLCSILLAASSLLGPGRACAALRPHYGGTLRIAVKESPASLDTLASNVPAGLSGLVFENLVRLDERGHPQPLLATSWQAEPGNQRWRFLLRSGVSFS